MPSPRAELAQIAADLAEAEQRRHDLSYRFEVARLRGDDPARIEVDLARVNAQLIALEERRAEVESLPANDVAPAQPQAPAPAAPSTPEYLTTAEAAALLRMSTDTLERLRARGEGPPFIRHGRRGYRYPIEGLRSFKK